MQGYTLVYVKGLPKSKLSPSD